MVRAPRDLRTLIELEARKLGVSQSRLIRRVVLAHINKEAPISVNGGARDKLASAEAVRQELLNEKQERLDRKLALVEAVRQKLLNEKQERLNKKQLRIGKRQSLQNVFENELKPALKAAGIKCPKVPDRHMPVKYWGQFVENCKGLLNEKSPA